jgi:nucleoside-diphosphate-sugar epimerase
VFNVACGARTTLVELFEATPERVVRFVPSAEFATLKFDPPRADDILHSFASIDRAKEALG